MPPRRPQKRRTADNETESPAKKRQGKNKREPTYETYDDAMDGGVEMEEKGERYRDGEKAQRFYERAVELYKKAIGFSQTYDAVYNQARALYTLSTTFVLPPLAGQYLTESLGLYRLATTLTNSPLLQMDVGFNLAQTASSLADMLEELDGEARRADVRALREEARDVLEQVLEGQAVFLESTSEDKDVEAAEDAVEDVEGEADQPAASTQAEADMAVDSDEEGGATYEIHLPTPSTLIDTVLALIDIHLSLWDSVDPPALPDEVKQGAVRSVLDRATAFVTPGRQAEMDLAEVKILLAMDGIVWDLYKSHAQAGSGIEKSLDGATMALGSLLANLDAQPPDEPTVRADVLTTLAETHTTVAHRLMLLAPQLPPGPSPLAQQAWYHLSQAITHLGKALDLSPTASTPRLFKPSLLLSMSKVSLARAKLSAVNDTAKRNVKQLVENAVSYAGRAADALGWGFLRLGSQTIGSLVLPYPSGWDSELLAREVVLQQLRVCLYVGFGDMVPELQKRFEEDLGNLLTAAAKVGDPNRKLGVKDVERWMGDLEDDGEIIEGERGFWMDVVAKRLSD